MAKGFSELFSESIKEYGNKFVPILKAFLFLYFIPIVILGIILLAIIFSTVALTGFSVSNLTSELDGVFTLGNIGTALFGSALFIIFVVVVLLLVILTLLLNISYIHISFAKGGNIPFSESFKTARAFFWRYLGLTIILSVFLIILYILLIVPGIIFTVYWLFASFILIRENTRIMESLKRSKSLVRRRWWRVFGYFLLVMIISIVVYVITGFIPIIGGLVPTLVVTPFVIIFLKNFYLDLRGKR